jgi:hypothetical protein
MLVWLNAVKLVFKPSPPVPQLPAGQVVVGHAPLLRYLAVSVLRKKELFVAFYLSS